MNPPVADAPTVAATPPERRKGGKGKKGGPIGSDFGGVAKEPSPEEKMSTPTALLAMAAQTESSKEEDRPSLADIAKALRQAATKIGALEKQIGDMGQTLQQVHMLTGSSLQGYSDPSRMVSLEVASRHAQPLMAADLDQEESQSFLVKKGDADVKEAHEKAVAQATAKPTIITGGGTTGGGSDGAPVKSKEEMDAARRARLERLEATQNAKSQEIMEAEKKKKAHDALFNQVGPNKPLGRL